MSHDDKPWRLTAGAIEDFRREHRITAHVGEAPEAGIEPWAEEHNRVLDAMCNASLASLSHVEPLQSASLQSVASPAGHSREGEADTANAAIVGQVGSQGPAPLSALSTTGTLGELRAWVANPLAINSQDNWFLGYWSAKREVEAILERSAPSAIEAKDAFEEIELWVGEYGHFRTAKQHDKAVEVFKRIKTAIRRLAAPSAIERKPSIPADIEILGHYPEEATDGRRWWWTGGTWLYPGDVVAVFDERRSASTDGTSACPICTSWKECQAAGTCGKTMRPLDSRNLPPSDIHGSDK